MTKLLLGIRNRRDVVTGIESGADILDIAADDRQPLSYIDKVIQAIDGYARLSLTVSLSFIHSDLDYPSLTSVDFFRVKIKENGKKLQWNRLEEFARKYKTVLLVNVDDADPSRWHLLLEQAEAAGFYGVMLESYAGNSLRLTQQYAIADIGRFVSEVKRRGLVAGLAGTLEAPDIPRLLPYDPDILGFSLVQIAGPDGRNEKKNRQLIRFLIPSEQDIAEDKIMMNLGTDRILISDFILPMHIGVYSHEQACKQKVCFNVSVDVTRVSINPEDMRHVFSYDLILDGIRTLVSLGHIDLVETLAERIAAFILGYRRVQRVMVRVEKLDLGPKAVGVEIVRTKNHTASF